MGQLSTHVLDLMNGCPAAGMEVMLQRVDGLQPVTLQSFRRLLFKVGAYFRTRGAVLPEPAFIDEVPLDFGIADPTARYHVPLLVSPWAYSTYRGS
jgi:5-hydroxyisourate hydrolase